jgi:hypothetical protein
MQIKTAIDDRKESRTDNRRLAQWRVKWLIEHSTSLYRPEISLHLLITKSVNKNEKESTQK